MRTTRLYPVVSHVSLGVCPTTLDADPLHANPLAADPLHADPPIYRPPGHVTCDACWEANLPPPEQNDTQV